MEYFKTWLDPETFDRLRGTDAATLFFTEELYRDTLLLCFRDSNGPPREPILCRVTAAHYRHPALRPGWHAYTAAFVCVLDLLHPTKPRPSQQPKAGDPADEEAAVELARSGRPQ